MRPEKESIKNEIRANLDGCAFVLLTDYSGLSVEQMTQLRHSLGDAQGRLQVVKHTLLRRASDEAGWQGLADMAEGQTAIVYGKGDVALAARTLRAFVKEHGLPVVRGGKLGATALSAADVVHLANLPSREVMLSILVGTVAAPMVRLAGTLSQKALSLIYVLKAIGEKKSAQK